MIYQKGDIELFVGNIQKFSVEDGPGIRTTVFLKGCPLRCAWCHNPEMISPNQQLMVSRANCIGCGSCIKACHLQAIEMTEEGIAIDREKCDLCMECTKACFAEAIRPVAKRMGVSEVMEVVLQDKGFYDNTGGGLTISGGEVLMQAVGAEALIREAAKEGVGVCLDTSGYGDARRLAALASHENVTDILYDIKSTDDEVHKTCTGVSNRRILENLRMLCESDALREKITVRVPLIAGINDDPAQIRETADLCERLRIGKVTLLPYHDLGVHKARNTGGHQQTFAAQEEEKIQRIYDEFAGRQIRTEILGRV